MSFISEIEEDFEKVKDQYGIEETQIQIYEEAPEATLTYRIGSNVIHGNTFIHTELRSIAVFLIMGTAFSLPIIGTLMRPLCSQIAQCTTALSIQTSITRL